MSRFNFELRAEVVSTYLAGKDSSTLAKEYGVSNASLISNWIYRFDRSFFDSESSSRSRIKKVVSPFRMATNN